ncbi:MAG: GAF domain-containing protein [Flavobacteriales bacterium]|nr:GAF domain-containing protein [Flavobacteriales bacterium]
MQDFQLSHDILLAISGTLLILFCAVVLYYRSKVSALRMKEREKDFLHEKLLETERKHANEQLAINYFAASMFGRNTVDDILWDVARYCISRLGFVDCVLYLFDKDKNVLIQKAAFGPKNPRGFEILNPIEIQLGKGIVGTVALSGRAEIIPDTSKDPRYIADDEVRFSEISVPIKNRDEVIGVIDSEHPQKGFFNSSHLRILETIVSLCANKIARVKAEEEKKIYASRIQAFIQNMPDFVVLSSPDGRRKFVNDSYLEFYEERYDEVVGSSFLHHVPDGERENYLASVKSISVENPTISNIHFVTSRSGKKQWILWNETGVFDDDGKLVEIISVGRNINQIKEAQLTKDAHIRTMEEILFKTSHEVRQPVANILGIAQIMNSSRQSPDEMKELVDYMKSSATSLDAFTRELTEFIYTTKAA